MIVSPPWWIVGIVGMSFGCIAYFAVQLSAYLCKSIVPFEDGPKPAKPPVAALIVGSAILGGVLVSQIGIGPALLLPAVVIFALVACCYSDVLVGVVLDYFTLVPLALVLALRIYLQDWQLLGVTLVVTLVFALGAFFSKGRGMGWGDVKLVALGAVVLGDRSLLAFAAACLAAVVVSAVRKRRGEPIAFAPYLAVAIAVGLTVPIFPRVGM